MTNRRHRFIDAALRYQQHLNAGRISSLEVFVQQEPAELRTELLHYLQTTFTLGDLSEPATLTAAEQMQVERAIARARDQFPQRAVDPASRPAPTLTALRTARRLSLGRLAQQLNLPIPLLDRIERGGVVLATLPDQLITRLATALHAADDQIRAALAATQATGARHASPGYLSAKDGTTEQHEARITFAEAFAASNPTPAQHADWQE